MCIFRHGKTRQMTSFHFPNQIVLVWGKWKQFRIHCNIRFHSQAESHVQKHNFVFPLHKWFTHHLIHLPPIILFFIEWIPIFQLLLLHQLNVRYFAHVIFPVYLSVVFDPVLLFSCNVGNTQLPDSITKSVGQDIRFPFN